jgi:hypothetical protein
MRRKWLPKFLSNNCAKTSTNINENDCHRILPPAPLHRQINDSISATATATIDKLQKTAKQSYRQHRHSQCAPTITAAIPTTDFRNRHQASHCDSKWLISATYCATQHTEATAIKLYGPHSDMPTTLVNASISATATAAVDNYSGLWQIPSMATYPPPWSMPAFCHSHDRHRQTTENNNCNRQSLKIYHQPASLTVPIATLPPAGYSHGAYSNSYDPKDKIMLPRTTTTTRFTLPTAPNANNMTAINSVEQLRQNKQAPTSMKTTAIELCR